MLHINTFVLDTATSCQRAPGGPEECSHWPPGRPVCRRSRSSPWYTLRRITWAKAAAALAPCTTKSQKVTASRSSMASTGTKLARRNFIARVDAQKRVLANSGDELCETQRGMPWFPLRSALAARAATSFGDYEEETGTQKPELAQAEAQKRVFVKKFS